MKKKRRHPYADMSEERDKNSESPSALLPMLLRFKHIMRGRRSAVFSEGKSSSSTFTCLLSLTSTIQENAYVYAGSNISGCWPSRATIPHSLSLSFSLSLSLSLGGRQGKKAERKEGRQGNPPEGPEWSQNDHCQRSQGGI